MSVFAHAQHQYKEFVPASATAGNNASSSNSSKVVGGSAGGSNGQAATVALAPPMAPTTTARSTKVNCSLGGFSDSSGLQPGISSGGESPTGSRTSSADISPLHQQLANIAGRQQMQQGAIGNPVGGKQRPNGANKMTDHGNGGGQHSRSTSPSSGAEDCSTASSLYTTSMSDGSTSSSLRNRSGSIGKGAATTLTLARRTPPALPQPTPANSMVPLTNAPPFQPRWEKMQPLNEETTPTQTPSAGTTGFNQFEPRGNSPVVAKSQQQQQTGLAMAQHVFGSGHSSPHTRPSTPGSASGGGGHATARSSMFLPRMNGCGIGGTGRGSFSDMQNNTNMLYQLALQQQQGGSGNSSPYSFPHSVASSTQTIRAVSTVNSLQQLAPPPAQQQFNSTPQSTSPIAPWATPTTSSGDGVIPSLTAASLAAAAATIAAPAAAPNSLYKTELCRSFIETGACRYGNKCQFAHGHDELRNISRHPKYKTELCRSYHTQGHCPYGSRCHFVHGQGQQQQEQDCDDSPLTMRELMPSATAQPGFGSLHNLMSGQVNTFEPPMSIGPQLSQTNAWSTGGLAQKIRGSSQQMGTQKISSQSASIVDHVQESPRATCWSTNTGDGGRQPTALGHPMSPTNQFGFPVKFDVGWPTEDLRVQDITNELCTMNVKPYRFPAQQQPPRRSNNNRGDASPLNAAAMNPPSNSSVGSLFSDSIFSRSESSGPSSGVVSDITPPFSNAWRSPAIHKRLDSATSIFDQNNNSVKPPAPATWQLAEDDFNPSHVIDHVFQSFQANSKTPTPEVHRASSFHSELESRTLSVGDIAGQNCTWGSVSKPRATVSVSSTRSTRLPVFEQLTDQA